MQSKTTVKLQEGYHQREEKRTSECGDTKTPGTAGANLRRGSWQLPHDPAILLKNPEELKVGSQRTSVPPRSQKPKHGSNLQGCHQETGKQHAIMYIRWAIIQP